MFVKLALRNVRRQIRSYLIYFVTVALSIALMFALNNLSYSDRIRKLSEISSDMRTMFTMVTVLSCVVTALVLSYATGFMLKLRKKEFGMYLTLGMTRRNIQALFACETGILSLFAMLAGMGAGLVIFQLLVALFASLMELPFAISAYSAQGILLTLAVSFGMFLLSTLVSLRYLKKTSMAELLKPEPAERCEKHPALWRALSIAAVAGLAFSMIATYRNLMAAFRDQDGAIVLLWLAVDLAMIFLSHFTLSRSLSGMLLRNERLKNRGVNAVVLRGLSARMTVNAMLIGALATILVFAVAMSNIALGEKVYTDHTLAKDCPYDVLAMISCAEKPAVSMEEGERILEKYSPIASRLDFQLRSAGETTLCSSVMGYDLMGWTDKYMALSQFNALLRGCGWEPVALDGQYLAVTDVQGICDVDFSEKEVVLNGISLSWMGSSNRYPDFARRAMLYFVVPDEALADMPVSDACAAWTLENHRPDAQAMLAELSYFRQTQEGAQEECDFAIQEEYRLWNDANTGTLMISTLYVSTVFVCMALAILSVKILSTLDEERRRFALLYRLGTDARTQKVALRRQIGAFFLAPFALPLLLTAPFGLIFGKVYEIWDLNGLSGRRAMETAVLIALGIAGAYALYYWITCSIACDHVIVGAAEPDGANGRGL